MENICTTTLETQFRLTFDNDTPGEIGKISGELSDAGVNIEAVCHTSGDSGDSTLRIIVDNKEEARKVLQTFNTQFSEDEVIKIISPQNTAGILGRIGKTLGDAGISIEDIYYTSLAEQHDVPVYVRVQKDTEKAMGLICAI